MALPDLIQYSTEIEYKDHYLNNYCNADTIITHDGIPVKFYPETFEHAFYKRTRKSWKAPKDNFFRDRGEKMDWIKHVLQDPSITPKKGYDKGTGLYDNTRRVTFMNEENYLVVIYINDRGEGKFVTAYTVDNVIAADKIRNSPDWERLGIEY